MTNLPCKDCISGSLHGDQPKGTVSTVYGLPTYIAEPSQGASTKDIIVMHCDAFGWELPNSRALADRYAERTGCRVYVPDFLDGNGVVADVMDSMDYATSPQPTWGATFYRVFPLMRGIYHFGTFMFQCRMAIVWPRTAKFFKDLRADQATQGVKVAVAGFCFGGLYVMTLAKDQENSAAGTPLIDCGFTAHPSFLTIPKDGNEAVRPVSVIVGDSDFALDHNSAIKFKAALEEKSKEHQMNILPKAKHGFAVRWNTHNEAENEQAKQAEDQAVNWFKKYFSSSK